MSNESNEAYEYEHEVGCTCGCNPEVFEQYKKQTIIKIIISAVFFAAGYILSEFTQISPYVNLVCFAISYLVVGFSVIRDAVALVISGDIFNEYLLISVVSLGALAIREFHEGCVVMLLFVIGDLVQGMAVSKSQSKINKMITSGDISDEQIDDDSSVLSRLENEINGTGRANRFISKFAKIYTPAVFLIAVLVIIIPPLFMHGEWKEWIYRGLSALVVGCPCAIVISVPLSFYFGVGAIVKDEKNGAFYAKRAKRVAKENIALTLIVKAVVLVMVVFLNQELPMWLAVFSDTGICLLAILNALRSAILKK